jgi:hypothetical protein
MHPGARDPRRHREGLNARTWAFEAVGPALHPLKSSIQSGRQRAHWLVCNLAPMPARSLQPPSVTKSRWPANSVHISLLKKSVATRRCASFGPEECYQEGCCHPPIAKPEPSTHTGHTRSNPGRSREFCLWHSDDAGILLSQRTWSGRAAALGTTRERACVPAGSDGREHARGDGA